MTIMYFADFRQLTITRVEVDRETASNVVVEGRQQAKDTQTGTYRATFQDAKEELAQYWDQRAQTAEHEMEYYKRMTRHAWLLMDGAA